MLVIGDWKATIESQLSVSLTVICLDKTELCFQITKEIRLFQHSVNLSDLNQTPFSDSVLSRSITMTLLRCAIMNNPFLKIDS